MRKIPFGLHDNKLYQPEEVSRGLNCNCVCPGCGSRLVAYHGTKKVKYFSHHSTESCVRGFESAIHKAAKQVLLEHKKIFVPAITASARFFNNAEEIEVNEDKRMSFPR